MWEMLLAGHFLCHSIN